jgi:hypothetical protein
MEPVQAEIAYSYTGFEDIEEEFGTFLDHSLNPRGPAMLLDVVDSLGLAVGSLALDVGSGEGPKQLRVDDDSQYLANGRSAKVATLNVVRWTASFDSVGPRAMSLQMRALLLER